AFKCSNKMPPWLWTIGFGCPDVPDENKTHKGSLNGTYSYVSPSSADFSVASCHGITFFKLLDDYFLLRYGTGMVDSNEGTFAGMFSTTGIRSNFFPPYS